MDLGGPSPQIEFDHAALDAAEAIAALPDVPMLNLVLGAGEPGAAAEGQLAAAVEWLESLRAGFEEAYLRPNWRRSPSPAAQGRAP